MVVFCLAMSFSLHYSVYALSTFIKAISINSLWNNLQVSTTCTLIMQLHNMLHTILYLYMNRNMIIYIYI